MNLRSSMLCCVFAVALPAATPRFHEAQTALALNLIPRDMAAFLRANTASLAHGARGMSSAQAPSIEDVEDQFQRVVRVSERNQGSAEIARELGKLAHLVQLLMDPSVTGGLTPLRETFEQFGDEQLARLVVTQEPFWAVTAPLDPRPKLSVWYKEKYEHYRILSGYFDAEGQKRTGNWDTLSVPFAQLQISFSAGVNATANLWIQLWRLAGSSWCPSESRP